MVMSKLPWKLFSHTDFTDLLICAMMAELVDM